LCAVAIRRSRCEGFSPKQSQQATTYEIASSAVASSQRQKQMLCKALNLLLTNESRSCFSFQISG
ncbi:MAG: hypothetical protein KKH02_09580, partial [Proteobacteria bacterium]|nr:hypothetical protein [Pseudomonadota bacterium]MBU4582641.1 hypothetical protein [Pseudomonadota bacterium]MCG2739281.1 hypothetical protein [Syntrophaceae bacterium]